MQINPNVYIKISYRAMLSFAQFLSTWMIVRGSRRTDTIQRDTT